MKWWPNLDNEPAVQRFVDSLCDAHSIARIPVMIRNAKLMGDLLGCVGNNRNGAIMLLNGAKLRIHAYARPNPPVIKHKWKKTERLHTVIHEFIHHLCDEKYKIDTKKHPKFFKEIEIKMNAEYGIRFDYDGEYASGLEVIG